MEKKTRVIKECYIESIEGFSGRYEYDAKIGESRLISGKPYTVSSINGNPDGSGVFRIGYKDTSKCHIVKLENYILIQDVKEIEVEDSQPID